MIKCIVIDDEQPAIDIMKHYISKTPELDLVGTFNNPLVGMQEIKKKNADLVFLDIQMEEMTGLEVMNIINENVKVILCTAYPQFALAGFDLDAVDYLLKPIDFEELKEAVNKISSSENHTTFEENLQKLMSQLQKPKEKRIALPVNHSLQFFDFEDIIRIESESNYSHIFLMDKRKITLSKTLKEVEEKFVGQDFFRIHQSHFINLNHIDKIYKGENAYLVMKDGTQISISRHRKDEFLDLIKKI